MFCKYFDQVNVDQGIELCGLIACGKCQLQEEKVITRHRQLLYSMASFLDTLRCVDEDNYKNICDVIAGMIGVTATNNLILIVTACHIATGDRILGSKKQSPYNAKLFVKCSTDPKYCFESIQKALQSLLEPHNNPSTIQP